MPAELTYGLAEPVQIRGSHDTQIFGRGERTSGDEGERRVRFSKLLLSVVHESGGKDVAVLCEADLGLLEVASRFGEQSFRRLELAAVHGADRVGREAEDRAGEG